MDEVERCQSCSVKPRFEYVVNGLNAGILIPVVTVV